MSRVVFCSDAPATPFLAGIVRLAYGRLKIQERSRPDGCPREAHGGAASLKAAASGLAVASRVSSPPARASGVTLVR